MNAGVTLKHENPKLAANILSKGVFAWSIPLFRKILQKGLDASDLHKILDSDCSEKLGDQLQINWTNEIIRAKLNNQKPKLLNSITKTFFWNYMIYGVILFIQHVGLRSFQPVVLSYLISQFAKTDTNRDDNMYISGAILVSISLGVVFTMHHCNFGQTSIGMRVRVALSSLIYRKILKLNKKSLNETAVGQIVNLLSNDVTRFDLVVIALHYLWILPFQAVLVTYLIWLQVGISSLCGVISVAVLSLPLQGYLGKLTSDFRLKVAQKTDNRVTLMSEIISGIQVIKMYAWEKPFRNIVHLARLQEVKPLTMTSYLRGIYISLAIFIERAALFLTLICYVLLGNVILAEQVFALAQFFNLLQLTMSIFYPLSISLGAEALVSIDRIQHFLMMEENELTKIETDHQKGVLLKNVNASWKPNQRVLLDLNFKIPPGALCAIVGPVGAGKSSILQLLLNELIPETGFIKIQGTVSYASQEPWLFGSTLRNNILFGEKYDRKLYRKVVKVCALQKDLDQLQQGDKTWVGERGSALSGGQRARVNLARAVYRDADVYLLDDPLSAVDTHVGKHLFEECIVKYLKHKTRILVTHQLQYLKKADVIIAVNNGRIEAQGTFEELSAMNLNYFSQQIIDETAEKEIVGCHLNQTENFMLESQDINSAIEEIQEEIGTPHRSSPLFDYIAASGSLCQIIFVVFSLILCQILCSGADFWVTFWTHQESLRNFTTDYPSEATTINTHTAIYIYLVLIVLLLIVSLIRSFSYFSMAMNSSKNLHNKMFTALLEAPMRFFNTNPSGRILNRFSKDMGAIDEILPKVLLEAIQITLVLCGILVMVVISNYYMIIAVVIMGVIFMKVRSWFIKSTKVIKHLEGIVKSPVFSHVNSSLHGITTIRAFDAQQMLRKEFDNLQDVHTSAWFLTIACMVSFGLWLDLICVVFIACTSFSFIILNYFGQVNGSMVGLAISQSLVLTGMLQYGIRQSAEVANQLTSVERVLQYTEIEKEGPFETPPANRPFPPWPKNGSIVMKKLSLQYSPSEPPVLKNLNIKIKPGQKIGIVGRTGAGKSSLIAAIFRLCDIDGDVFIDGVNTKHLGLHDLRKSVSIIPQEPVLFSETLRYNLDPFNEFDDRQLWKVLEEVELKEIASSLDMMVAGGGKNFSVGQRQLLCLARAILRNNKILVLDEATANIDEKTDSLIQQTIRKKFKDCTVLTVAHRLNTIMDSDRVMVMDDGKVVEFNYPYELLQRPDTNFYKMVLETGQAMSIHLEEIALDAFLSRRQE